MSCVNPHSLLPLKFDPELALVKMKQLFTFFVIVISEHHLTFGVEDESGKFYKSNFYGIKSSSKDENSGLAWLRGEYDYSNGGNDEPVFDHGPQYQAPAPVQAPMGGYEYQPQLPVPAQGYPNPPHYQQQQPHFRVIQENPPPVAMVAPQQQQQVPQAHYIQQQQVPQTQYIQQQQLPVAVMAGGVPPQQNFMAGPPPPQQIVESKQQKQTKGKDKPNKWLFEGEAPAPTFSANDERIRQQKFSGTITKYETNDQDRQRQQALTNKEGSIVINKGYVDSNELVHGAGKRIHHNFEVIAEGPGSGIQAVYAPLDPQYRPPAPDNDLIKPREYYAGRINPDEGTKFLQETYAIPPRKMNSRKNQNQKGNANNQHKGRSHALVDPPAEIINSARWFDDDEEGANCANNFKVYNASILIFMIAFTLNITFII